MAYESKEDVRPQEGRQSEFFQMVADQEADLYFIGGSRFGGKTELASMLDLLFAGDKNYRSIKFRRSFTEIMGANGLWDKAKNQYPLFGAKPNKSDHTWTFPSGARAEYAHMFNTGDEETHRGKGYSAVIFDEINQFDWSMAKMLMTCLRSEADMNSFMVGTLNPDPDSWCMKFISYYLQQDTGFPDLDKCGKIRYYILHEDEPVFGDSEQFFIDNYRDSVYPTLPDGTEIYVRPKRFTFFFFNIFDNEIGLKMNPGYISELNNLPAHERDTQLLGNWFSREQGDNLFRREFLKISTKVPASATCVRAWDKAYSDSPKGAYDFTASIKMWKCKQGDFYITGDFDPTIHDTFKAGQDIIYGRFKRLAGQRNELMLQQAYYDGDECKVIHPAEGSAGKGEMEQITKMFLADGFKVGTIATGNVLNAKMKKFVQFSAAAQMGIVHIIPDSFPNIATYNAYLKELEMFTGERSTATVKDDWVDATSDCYLALQNTKVRPSFGGGSLSQGTSSATKLATHKNLIK